jgi:hypothetical protein
MTVHLISVGVSILEAMKHPAQKNLPADLGQAFSDNQTFDTNTFGFGVTEREAASTWAVGALTAPGEPGHNQARSAQLRDIAAALDIPFWPNYISAEIQTFRYAPKKGNAFPLGRDDIAILICSDTPRGLLAGVWNALGLTEGDLSRVIYLPEPGTDITNARGKAVLARITNMDTASSDGFTKAMRGLGTLACRLFESGCLTEDDDFRFYLSGGFKAAIPYLIGMAEAIRSLDETRLAELGAAKLAPANGVFPVKAFVMHELSDPPAPIELPLRRLSTTAIRRELGRFTGTTRQVKPEMALLDGYAYDVAADGKGYALTPFGEGLKTLFGIPAEGYG